MALSFNSVKKAYEVFNQLKKEFSSPEIIPSWPKDIEEWTESERKNPELNTVYGWGKKSDNGWENIFFFVKNPSEELKSRFNELSVNVPNTKMSKKYTRNTDLYIIGWI